MRKVLSYILVILICISLCSCDVGSGIVSIEIDAPPSKLEYIAGQDTELDLTGMDILVINLAGDREVYLYQEQSSGEPTVAVENNNILSKEVVYKLYDHDWASTGLKITHDIDFSTPGEYDVYIVVRSRLDGIEGPHAMFTVRIIDDD